MSKYRSSCILTPYALIMDGVRYEGSMFKIDKMSQDTVHEWSIYNPDLVKPVEVQLDDLCSIY